MMGRVVSVGNQFDGLHHVGVASDDVVYALADEPAGKVALFSVGCLLVFVAPVQDGDDGIGAHGSCLLNVFGKLGAVEAIDNIGWCGANAIGSIGSAEKYYAYSVFLY